MSEEKTKREKLLADLLIVVILLGVLWVLEIVDQAILDQDLDRYGIIPREWSGLIGVITAPFLHGGYGHLAANSIPFLVLGAFVILRGRMQFVLATLLITVVGGLAVWIVARTAIHIGASGLIFGYFGFLIMVGVLERSFKAILVAIAVGFLYGGLLWGVLPDQPGISWEGHLFGLLAGGGSAFLLADRKGKKKKKKDGPAKAPAA